MKTLLVFDLDGTLAESKAAVDGEMATLLIALLGIVKVAVISGGDWLQFQTQLLAALPRDPRLENLSLLPTSGTKFYRYQQGWRALYSEDFSADEKVKIESSLTQALGSAGYKVEHAWGEITQDRGSQITFSALGQQAPIAEKKSGTLILPNASISRHCSIRCYRISPCISGVPRRSTSPGQASIRPTGSGSSGTFFMWAFPT